MRANQALAFASELRFGNPERQSEAFRALKEYFSHTNPENGTYRRLKRLLLKIDNPYSRILVADQLYEKPGLIELVTRAGINLKELEETRAFYKEVFPVLGKRAVLYDLCCGNGLNGFYWLWQKSADFVYFVDNKPNNHFYSLLGEVNPEAFTFSIEDIFTAPSKNLVREKDAALIAVHACGHLSDRVIALGLEARASFAVMPCCYSRSLYMDAELLRLFDNPEEVIDALRIYKILEQGYEPQMRRVSAKITEKNRIIIGIPPNQENH